MKLILSDDFFNFHKLHPQLLNTDRGEDLVEGGDFEEVPL